MATSSKGVGEDEYCDAPQGVRTGTVDATNDMDRHGGLWVVIERLGRGGVQDEGGGGEVDVEVLSDGFVWIGAWGVGEG